MRRKLGDFPIQHATQKSEGILFNGERLQHLRTFCKTVTDGWPSLLCQRENIVNLCVGTVETEGDLCVTETEGDLC